MYTPNDIISNAASRYDDYCEGFNGQGQNYLLALNLATSAVPQEFTHNGSKLLDEINAFDVAETRGALIGQINMITVSSFCGPMGAILGYDFLQPSVKPEPIFTIEQAGLTADVFDAEQLLAASRALFGTLDAPRYPIVPGSHTFCAAKNIKVHGPAHIYSAIGLGIANDRSLHANLMMEDVGEIPLDVNDVEEYKNEIKENVAKSVLQVGVNQGVEYQEVFVGIADQYCREDEVACALVASPYFTMAQSAFTGFDADSFASVSIDEWLDKQQ